MSRRKRKRKPRKRTRGQQQRSNQYNTPDQEPRIPTPSTQLGEKSASPVAEANAAASGAQEQEPNKYIWPPLWYLGVEVFVGVALVAFAAVQGIVAFWQWDATDKQWRIMVADQRPWLKTDENIILELAPGKPPKTSVTVKNVGKRPAHLMEQRIAVAIVPESKLDEAIKLYEQGSVPAIDTAIAPEGISRFNSDNAGMPFDGTELEDIAAGRSSAFVIARFKYRDEAMPDIACVTYGIYRCDLKTGSIATIRESMK